MICICTVEILPKRSDARSIPQPEAALLHGLQCTRVNAVFVVDSWIVITITTKGNPNNL